MAPERVMTPKPTIKTVAAHAGVAVSTVSRYLNGRYVSRAAQDRVARVIEELGYTRSWTARNLSLGRRGCIGVVVDSSKDPWFVQLLAGIEEELSTRDASLMLSSLELTGEYDPRIVLEWIAGRRVDGLILAKSQRRERSLLKAAAEARLPAVTVAPDEAVEHVQIVRCDNVAAGVAVAQHLADLGHRAIAFGGGRPGSLDSMHRLKGLRNGLAERGIRLDPRFVFACDSYLADAGADFARRMFEQRWPVTAVVLANDALAFGFMRAAQQLGVRMPQDLSILGFDGLPHGALFFPALTSVAQPMREMGRAACQRLFEAIEDPGRRDTIEFPMTLLVRESTGPAPLSSVTPLRLLNRGEELDGRR
jgi:DNA-binding LacI/PurR family transcriptional regulator